MRVAVPVVHKEAEIPPEFKQESNDGDFWCFLTNFEFRDIRNSALKSPEFMTEKGVSLVLTGYLLTPEDYKSSPDDAKGEYFVKIANLIQWAFDHEDETRGVWVESKRHWFKLIKPTAEFKVIYDSFEKKSNIWLDLRPVLTRWFKKFDKCSDEDTESVVNDLTFDYVMKFMKSKGHTEDELIENAFFVHDKAVQDFETFSLEDSTENQLLRTPFMRDLLELSSEKSKIPIISKKAVAPKEKQLVNIVDDSSSDEDMQVKIVIDDYSSSDESDDEEYFVTVKDLSDDDEESQEESEEDYEESLKKKKKSTPQKSTPEKKRTRPSVRGPYKKKAKIAEKNDEKKTEKVDSNVEKVKVTKPKPKKVTPKKKKDIESEEETTDDEESNEENNHETKRKRKKTERKKATVFYYKEYTPEPGLPTMQELLNQEFTPRLITQLSTKYEPGLLVKGCHNCHKKRIVCLKERPICSHCLEDGLHCQYPQRLKISPCVPCALKTAKVCNRESPQCNHCEKGECYYFTSDNGLMVAEMKIAALKELYAKIDAAKEQGNLNITENSTEDDKDDNEISEKEIPIVEEDKDEQQNDEELKKNQEKVAALEEELKKLKAIFKEEKELTETKKKELKKLFNFLNSN